MYAQQIMKRDPPPHLFPHPALFFTKLEKSKKQDNEEHSTLAKFHHVCYKKYERGGKKCQKSGHNIVKM